MDQVFQNFILGLTRHPWLKHSTIVFVPERSCGHEPGRMEKFLHLYGQFVSSREKIDANPGIFTKNAIKMECAFAARDQIAQDSVAFLEDFVCENPFQKEETRRALAKDKFIKQMKGYRFVNVDSKTPFQNTRMTVSGKVNDQGKVTPGRNDDLFVTFTLINYWMSKFYRCELPGIDYRLLQDQM